MNFHSLNEIDWPSLVAGQKFFASPSHWEDEVIYFLMADRFSDGRENLGRDNENHVVTSGTTPPYTPDDNGNAIKTEAEATAWRNAGTTWVGGTLAGIQSKLGYLSRLGITVLWISPVLKQVNVDDSYHGYGIQDFLQVDPHFGTREDLQRLVTEAHSRGLRVILDVILNHSGDVFRYTQDNPSWTGQTYEVRGFRDRAGSAALPFGTVDLAAHPAAFPDGAIWPMDFQTSASFTREGHINNFDYFPEYADGDFFGLKDLHHGDRQMVGGIDQIDGYSVSPTLRYLCEVYKYWIAFADLDGFRLDTVKHMDPGATRYFASVIHEFAEGLGKDNFYIIGEIAGGREFAFARLEVTGLDAALGISDERSKMDALVKGNENPADYFDLFRNSLLVGKESNTWFRDKIVTSIDDHDHVDQGQQKHRFAAGGFAVLSLAVMGLNATTLGIPCVYYGTEQQFDGAGNGDSSDRYIREAMFGGAFGAFRSQGVHFFLEDQSVFQEVGKIHQLRREQIALRRGRQYLRPISGDGFTFGLPQVPANGERMLSIVAWSRLFNDTELLCAINTDPASGIEAFVTIDNDLHGNDLPSGGNLLTCLYSSDATEIGKQVTVQARNGKAVELHVPAAGFVVYR